MVIRILLIFSFINFLLAQVNAQDYAKIDSLKNTISKTNTDTTRINLLLKLGDIYGNRQPDSALFYFDKAKKIAIHKKLPKYVSTSLYRKGFLYYTINNYDKSLKNFRQSLKISREIKDSSSIASTLNQIAVIYFEKGDFDKSLNIFFNALKVSQSLRDTNKISQALFSIGVLYSKKCDYDSALYYFNKAEFLSKKNENYDLLPDIYSNIGIVYSDLGKYDKSLKYYFKSLEFCEKEQNDTSIALNYRNIGVIYSQQGDNENALKYYTKALTLFKKIKYKRYIAQLFRFIGQLYSGKDIEKAYFYFLSATKMNEELGNKSALAKDYRTLGTINARKGKYEKAMEFYKKSLVLEKETGDKYGISIDLYYIGNIFYFKKKYDKALFYYKESLLYANKIGALEQIVDLYGRMSKTYRKIGNLKKALAYVDSFIVFKDSLYNKDKADAIAEMSAKYESEKKEQQIKLQKAELLKSKAVLSQVRAEQERQKAERNMFIVAFGLTLILVIFIYRSYREKKKTNRILERQKAEIAEKNEELNQQNEEIRAQRDEIGNQKNILENLFNELNQSISYAKRLQQSVLPSFELLERNVSEYFVLYRPKDKVSGDFYWWTYLEDKDMLIITVADCTGHGVPGAFMSMLGISLLREIVEKDGECETDVILNRLREEVIRALKQRGKEGEQKDGMDMAIVSIDYKSKKLQYSGANNPLYLIRTNECKEKNDRIKVFESADFGINTGKYLCEIKPDKMPIAIYEKNDNFTKVEIMLEEGDLFYMFSDGFADQFGGEKGKKYKYKSFKKLLLSISDLPMNEQKQKLEGELDTWMHGYGNDYEQVDDITVVGIRS